MEGRTPTIIWKLWTVCLKRSGWTSATTSAWTPCCVRSSQSSCLTTETSTGGAKCCLLLILSRYVCSGKFDEALNFFYARWSYPCFCKVGLPWSTVVINLCAFVLMVMCIFQKVTSTFRCGKSLCHLGSRTDHSPRLNICYSGRLQVPLLATPPLLLSQPLKGGTT